MAYERVESIKQVLDKVDKLEKEQEAQEMELKFLMACNNDLTDRVRELEAKLAKRSVV